METVIKLKFLFPFHSSPKHKRENISGQQEMIFYLISESQAKLITQLCSW